MKSHYYPQSNKFPDKRKGYLRKVPLLILALLTGSIQKKYSSSFHHNKHPKIEKVIKNNENNKNNEIFLHEKNTDIPVPILEEIKNNFKFNFTKGISLFTSPTLDIKLRISNKVYSNNSTKLIIYKNGTPQSADLTAWMRLYLNISNTKATDLIIDKLNTIKASQNLDNGIISLSITRDIYHNNNFSIQITFLQATNGNYTNKLNLSLDFTYFPNKNNIIPFLRSSPLPQFTNNNLKCLSNIQDIAQTLAYYYLQTKNKQKSDFT